VEPPGPVWAGRRLARHNDEEEGQGRSRRARGPWSLGPAGPTVAWARQLRAPPVPASGASLAGGNSGEPVRVRTG
jgi:hypothetical protein